MAKDGCLVGPTTCPPFSTAVFGGLSCCGRYEGKCEKEKKVGERCVVFGVGIMYEDKIYNNKNKKIIVYIYIFMFPIFI